MVATIGALPSLLDRLRADEPPASLNQFIQSIRRDLEALLNTRQSDVATIPAEFEEARRSLLVYGLPELSAFNFRSENDKNRLAQILKNIIASFEPRLHQVRVEPETLDELHPALHFRIEGMLKVSNLHERLVFATTIEADTGKCRIETA